MELRSTIIEMKNSLERINSRLGRRSNELENRLIYIIQSEEERIKKHKQNLRDLRNSSKHINMQIREIPEKEERERKRQKIFIYIMVEYFQNFITTLIKTYKKLHELQIGKTQRIHI